MKEGVLVWRSRLIRWHDTSQSTQLQTTADGDGRDRRLVRSAQRNSPQSHLCADHGKDELNVDLDSPFSGNVALSIFSPPKGLVA